MLGEEVQPTGATLQLLGPQGEWQDERNVQDELDVQHVERIIDDPQFRVIKRNKEDFTLWDIYQRGTWARAQPLEWTDTTPALQSRSTYPIYIMKMLRQRLGVGEDDTSRDVEVNLMTKNQAFNNVLEWEGIIGYEYKIRDWIRDIYGIELV